MQQFKIGPNEAGQRLDKFLHKYLKEAGNSFLYKMLRKKNITLNKKKADGKEILEINDEVQFFFSEETFEKFRGKENVKESLQENKMRKNNNHGVEKNNLSGQYNAAFAKLKGIEIVYESEHILLLNKPAGILSQKSAPTDLSVNEWLIGYLLANNQISGAQLETFKPSICNRLDRNTSGLMICGKSLAGSQRMNSLIKERKVRKFYRTIVKGNIEEGSYIKGFLRKDENMNKVFLKESISKDDKEEYVPIETAYEPIFGGDDYTYLEVELITGKTHQIRAHLAFIGHPLLGDEKYGNKEWNHTFTNMKLPKWQLLHSYRLEFPELEGEFKELSKQIFVAKEPEIYHVLKENIKGKR